MQPLMYEEGFDEIWIARVSRSGIVCEEKPAGWGKIPTQRDVNFIYWGLQLPPFDSPGILRAIKV